MKLPDSKVVATCSLESEVNEFAAASHHEISELEPRV
jgi:hypothetical protein